jgi:hypothetical protein
VEASCAVEEKAWIELGRLRLKQSLKQRQSVNQSAGLHKATHDEIHNCIVFVARDCADSFRQ